MLKRDNSHFYIITTVAPISALGGITGPINTPVKMTPYQAYQTLCEGHTVYEVNQYDTSERYLITKSNYNKIIFKSSKSDMIKRRRLNTEIRGIDKKEEKVLSSDKKEQKLSKEEKKKLDLEKNEGKADVEPIPTVMDESEFKQSDFKKS